MKKLRTFAIASLAILMCACSSSTNSTASETAEIPNPYVDYETLEEAEKAAGFEITIPDSIDDSETIEYRVMDDIMIEIIYRDGDGKEIARIRKEAGDEDISGDSNNYELDEEAEENGVVYRLRGNEDLYYLTTWTADDYSYSFSYKTGAAQDAMLNMVSLFS